MTETDILILEPLRNQLRNLEETIGWLHRLTLDAPRDSKWDKVRDEVSAVDSMWRM